MLSQVESHSELDLEGEVQTPNIRERHFRTVQGMLDFIDVFEITVGSFIKLDSGSWLLQYRTNLGNI